MLAGRDIIRVSDLEREEMDALFSFADELAPVARGKSDLCRGKVLAALFYEPSTRTRLSFETAMLRLGGDVISCADPSASSAAKGETLADTVRIVEGYADVIVIRHPLEGSAAVAALYCNAPVVNAGDGAHEHPTQTLLDLYTLRAERGRIEGAWVLLVGDLKYGRAAHSFAYGLALFRANMACVCPPGLEMEGEVSKRLARISGRPALQFSSIEDLEKDEELRAASGGKPMRLFDAIYVTRIQKERFRSPEEFEAVRSSYSINAEVLRRAGDDTVVMHPLPRVDELDYGLDSDPRAAYFRQASRGVPVRMALLAAILGKSASPQPRGVGARHAVPLHAPPEYPKVETPGLTCENPRCITGQERHLAPDFREIEGTVCCAYCERPIALDSAGPASRGSKTNKE
jgi:aspartate carbamoyltransferase catalytic subunit